MPKIKTLYSMRTMAKVITGVDPRHILAEAYRLKIPVMETGKSKVVDEAGKDRLVKHFAATSQLATAN